MLACTQIVKQYFELACGRSIMSAYVKGMQRRFLLRGFVSHKRGQPHAQLTALIFGRRARAFVWSLSVHSHCRGSCARLLISAACFALSSMSNYPSKSERRTRLTYLLFSLSARIYMPRGDVLLA